MMFRVIGAAVVYGFALYGAARFFDRPRMEVLIKADTRRQDEGKPDHLKAEAVAGQAGRVVEKDIAAAESASAKISSWSAAGEKQ